jgi:iron complex transport system permease protein
MDFIFFFMKDSMRSLKSSSLKKEETLMDDLSRQTGISGYLKQARRKYVFLLILALLLFMFMIFAIGTGSMQIPFSDVISIILGNDSGQASLVIWHLRIPRVLAAVIGGAALGMSGTVMQCVLRNPLGSSFTLGISQASAFGAALGILILGGGSIVGAWNAFIQVQNPYLVTFCAFTMAMLATTILILLVKITMVTPEAMILAGVALSSLFAAGLAALQFLSNDAILSTIVYWTFGDLSKITMNHALFLFIILIGTGIYFFIKRLDYNAIDTDEDVARGLGIDTNRTRILGMTASSLMTAAFISFAGVIGFVGLVAPHMVRKVIGGDHRFLLPGSMVTGSLLLLASDTVGRSVFTFTIPVGIITAFLGAPLFLYILIWGYKRNA